MSIKGLLFSADTAANNKFGFSSEIKKNRYNDLYLVH